jgi:hypothetical protein
MELTEAEVAQHEWLAAHVGADRQDRFHIERLREELTEKMVDSSTSSRSTKCSQFGAASVTSL